MTKVELTMEMFVKCWTAIQPTYLELARSGKSDHMGNMIEAYHMTFNCHMYSPDPLQVSTDNHDGRPNYILFFDNDEDATMFLLKWS